MLKNLSQLECKVGEKVFHLTCDPDSSLEHLKEALFQFQKFVGRVEDQAKASQEQANQSKQEEVKQENVDESKDDSQCDECPKPE